MTLLSLTSMPDHEPEDTDETPYCYSFEQDDYDTDDEDDEEDEDD